MRAYAKVLPRFWQLGSGRALRGDPAAQVLALYLMTCPAGSMSGLFVLPIPTMAHETGLSTAVVRKALERLAAEGVALYDETADLVWVVNGVRFQVGDAVRAGDKRTILLRRQVEAFRGSPLALAWVERHGVAFHVPSEAAMVHGMPHPMPHPMDHPMDHPMGDGMPHPMSVSVSVSGSVAGSEQPEGARAPAGSPEHGARASARGVCAPSPTAPLPAGPDSREVGSEIAAHYRKFHPKAFPRGLTPGGKEARALAARVRDGWAVDDLKRAIDGYHGDAWHCGQNERGKAFLSLELILRDQGHVQEGIEMLAKSGAPPPVKARPCDYHRAGQNTGKPASRHVYRLECAECKLRGFRPLAALTGGGGEVAGG